MFRTISAFVLYFTMPGIPHEELMSEMNKLKAEELNAEDGRMFAYVYTGESSSFELQRKAHKMFTGNIIMNCVKCARSERVSNYNCDFVGS